MKHLIIVPQQFHDGFGARLCRRVETPQTLRHDVRMRDGHPSYSRSRCNPSESRIAWHREQTSFATVTPFAGSLISAA
jgi:hypothetical protein